MINQSFFLNNYGAKKNVRVTLKLKVSYDAFVSQAADSIIRKCIFASHFVGGVIQLLLYTWTCNDIIVQSTAICDAAYNSKWYVLPSSGSGMALRKGLIMIMIRARRPCALNAGRFAVMSLETFMGVSAM